MATDGPRVPRCDREVYEDGEVVLIIHSIPPNAFEKFIKRVAAESGQRVDWHYACGRNVVKALGNTQAVCDVLERLESDLDLLQEQGIKHYTVDKA